MENIRWERVAAMVICAAAAGALLYLLYRFALPLLLPFLLAWLLSLAVRPMAERLSKRFHLSETVCATMRYVISAPLERLLAFRISEEEEAAFELAAEQYLLHHVETGYDTLKFYKDVIK